MISVDTWLLGQLRPGAGVRFARVPLDEARALAAAWRRFLAGRDVP